MTDEELVKRLRDVAEATGPNEARQIALESSDRIEELEAKLAENEVRLGKAVEALRGLMQHMPDYADTVWQDARATLAEIEGEKG